MLTALHMYFLRLLTLAESDLYLDGQATNHVFTQRSVCSKISLWPSSMKNGILSIVFWDICGHNWDMGENAYT